jgi:hypothetical protein
LSLGTHGRLLLSQAIGKGPRERSTGLNPDDTCPSRTVPVFAFGSIMDWQQNPIHGHLCDAPPESG